MSPLATSAAELVTQFEKAATAAAATVERIPRSPDAVAQAVLRATAGSERILLDEPHDLAPELLAAFRTDPRIISNPSDEQLSSAHAGITEAFAAVARTGSLCVRLHGMTAAESLLAPLHVALLRAEAVVERPRDLFTSGAAGLANDFVFITGPSATADMGPLVRGVHGPHRLHVIVLE